MEKLTTRPGPRSRYEGSMTSDEFDEVILRLGDAKPSPAYLAAARSVLVDHRSTKEASESLGVSRQVLYRMIKNLFARFNNEEEICVCLPNKAAELVRELEKEYRNGGVDFDKKLDEIKRTIEKFRIAADAISSVKKNLI